MPKIVAQSELVSELTEEQKKLIDNYGENIKTLKDFMTAVQTRVGMYIGARGTRGYRTMIREILDNAVDTIIDPNSPGNWFSVTYNQNTREVTVIDNGRGLPHDEIIRILTTQHTSKNFNPIPYNYPSGLNGVGAKIVNALSKVFIVESYKYDGTAVRVEFSRGYPKTNKPIPIENKEKKQGTMVYFIPNEEIMGDMDLHWESLYTLIKQKISLGPIGMPCDFTAIDSQGNVHKERIVNKDGIITDIISKVKFPLIKPIRCFNDDGYHKLEIAFCFDSDENNLDFDENLNITAFSNMCPTSKGTHIKGSLNGICKWFCKYMNSIYLLNQKSKDKLVIIPNDIKNGLYIMINAAHLTPDFTGQAKEELSNEDMEAFCQDTVMMGLDEWSKNNPQDLAKMAKFIKDMGEIRIKQSKEKEKIVQKYSTSSVLSGLPRKLKRCTGKKGVELYIVEGDSALGSVLKARDDTFQAILPIRGKIINAFNCNKQKFFSNEEVQAITKIILGTEYKKNFDVSECKVDKVIFLADGDVDRKTV